MNKSETENVTIDENTSAVKTSDKLTIIVKEGITYEYYYNNELNKYGPFFILKSEKQGDETITERFYFEHGKIIRHLNNSDEKQPLCDAMYAPEDDEHYQSRIYYSLFYNAIALQATEINKLVEKNDILANKISTDIENGLYKKGDCQSHSEGEGYSATEEYLDKNNNRIYYSSEDEGEGGGSSSEEYYLEGKLILSIRSESYYPMGECDDVLYYSWNDYEKEIETYYDNGTIIREYTTYANGDITEITNY